ncbi:MAG: tetratricopeptide repeat protein [Eubacteriales bacterium]|nr:tetratricopeptide repeat protein [Eubacteriales bacterium]
MKKSRTAIILAVCMGATLFAGCGSEKQKIYEQAGKDLEQGSYEYALQGYEASVQNEVKLPHSYRGAGIANLRLGNYEAAAECFTNALNSDNMGKALRKDVLSYRATAYFKAGAYEDAMADCQTLSEDGSLDADGYYLTGKVALEMDSYEEASSNFEQAYVEDSTYDMAIRIYQAYIEKGMEADGTRYLEAALKTEPKDAQDYCDRGRVYYYMEDYDNAQKELIEAANQESSEAVLLLGMVYLAQNDVSNARVMYQEYVSKEGASAKGYNGLALCDIEEGNYSNALTNISNGLPSATTEEMQSLLFNEIVVYEKMLDFPTAQQKAREYLEMFPEDEAAAKELAFLKTRITDSGAAGETGTQQEGDGGEGGAEEGGSTQDGVGA